MEGIFWQAAGPLIGDGEPSAVLLAGMMVLAADGMLVNLADTPANRAFFGCTGTAAEDGEGAAPFPQLKIVALAARAGHAMLGAVTGQARAGEQTLLKRLVKRRPDLFAGRVTCFDRNFPGHDLITAILDAGGHVIARVKEGISLDFADSDDRGWLPGGSRMSWLNAPSGKEADRLPVRVAEHDAIMPRGDGKEEVSETCTVITTLLDHQAAPAEAVREAYLTRWSASETTFGEDKTTIAGVGNRTSGPVLRSGCPRLVIQEAWAWLTATQLTRASAAAALRGEAAQARRPAQQRQRPGHRRRGILHRRPPSHDPVHDIIPGHGRLLAGRDRRRRRRCRPRRPAHPQPAPAAAALRTRAESTPQVPARHRHQDHRHRETPGHHVRARLLLARPGPETVRKEENRPAHPGPRTVEPRATPPRRAGTGQALTPSGNGLPYTHGTRTPQHPRKPGTPKVRGVGVMTRPCTTSSACKPTS